MASLVIIDEAYRDIDLIGIVTNYVINGGKTGNLIGGQGVFLNSPAFYMMTVRDYYMKDSGRMLEHFILSFDVKEEIGPNGAFSIGYDVCALFPDYQLVFGVHTDTDNLHIHWAMNTVNLRTGNKFNFTNSKVFWLRKEMAKLLEPYKIPCVLRIGNQDENGAA